MYRTLRKCRLDALYGLDLCGVGRRQRMQRIQADESRAARRRPADQHAQDRRNRRCPNCRAIAACRAARRCPTAAGRRESAAARSIAAAEMIEETAIGSRGGYFRLEFVIAGRQVERQLETPARDPRSIDLAAPELAAIGGRGDPFAARAVLELHAPYQCRSEFARGDIDVDADSRAARRGDRRQEPASTSRLEFAQICAPRQPDRRPGIPSRATAPVWSRRLKYLSSPR